MSAKKVEPKRLPWPVRGLALLAGARSHRALLMIAALVLGFVAGAYVLWHRVADHVLSNPDYVLTAERIRLSPAPAWITTDIRAEVVRDASLDRPISILDPNVVERVAKAFALHPWVGHVQQISKHHPARVDVVLIYREPVAMVEVPGGLYPVDIQGTVLPSADFTAQQASQYPRLAGVDTIPVGPVGTYWGDARVRGGAAVASALREAWSELRLARIVPSSTSNTGTFELLTSGQIRILWGHAPGSEAPGEALAEEKIAQLRDFAAEHGSLDAGGDADIDVRTPRPAVTPQTAQAESPAQR